MKSKKRSPWEKAKAVENEYSRALRKVADQIDNLVKGFVKGADIDYPPLIELLKKYADFIMPWAERKAALFVAHVNKKDLKSWKETTGELSQGIKQQIRSTPVGLRFKELMSEQVKLIRSLPEEAAQRIHKLVMQNASTSLRSTSFLEEILKSGEVSKARAKSIARTETSRAATVLTQARAENIGSEGYTWRTMRDRAVRHSHKKMEGKFVPWRSPPTLDGMTGHAGEFPNCRCYAEPVIPKELLV